MSAKLMGTIIQEVNLPYKEKWTLTILQITTMRKSAKLIPQLRQFLKTQA